MLLVVGIGGYPRLWRRNGDHFELSAWVPPEEADAFEAHWREAHVHVEWLLSPRGRLDRVLPQTLQRLVHNQNIRSWIERNRA